MQFMLKRSRAAHSTHGTPSDCHHCSSYINFFFEVPTQEIQMYDVMRAALRNVVAALINRSAV